MFTNYLLVPEVTIQAHTFEDDEEGNRTYKVGDFKVRKMEGSQLVILGNRTLYNQGAKSVNVFTYVYNGGILINASSKDITNLVVNDLPLKFFLPPPEQYEFITHQLFNSGSTFAKGVVLEVDPDTRKTNNAFEIIYFANKLYYRKIK